MQYYNENSAREHINEMQRQRNHDKLVQEAKGSKPGWFARLLNRPTSRVTTPAPETRTDVLCDPRTAKAQANSR
jgi:hypothetical protein